MNDEHKTRSEAVIQKFLLGLVSIAIVALVGLVINLDRRVALIEANRFTDRDAGQMERRIIDQTPPEWLLDRLDAMENRIDERLKTLADAVEALR